MNTEIHRGSKKLILNLLLLLKESDLDLSMVCGKSKISFDKFLSGEEIISGIDADCIWETAIASTKNGMLGLQLGLNLDISTLGTYGMILQKSANLFEALQNASKFMFLITDIVTMEVERKNNEIIIDIIPAYTFDLIFKSRIDQSGLITLGFIIRIYEILTFQKPQILKIMVPSSFSDYSVMEAMLGKQVSKSSDRKFTLVLDSKNALTPLQDYDVNLLQLLLENVKHHNGLLDNTWTAKVRSKIMDVDGNIISLDQVAKSLQLSSRSLQRKLSDENTSYKDICEATKCDLAKYYMYNDHNFKSIASRLGYFNVASFNRAFRSWTGMTLHEYQKIKKTPIH